jgi:VanZ family protein
MWRFLLVLQFYCLIAIYTFLGLTPHPESIVGSFNDLLMHFVGYFIAAFSISLARPQWPWWQQAMFLIVYSTAIEIAQHFNPPRTFSIADMLANSLGVLLGLAVLNFLGMKIPFVKRFLG